MWDAQPFCAFHTGELEFDHEENFQSLLTGAVAVTGLADFFGSYVDLVRADAAEDPRDAFPVPPSVADLNQPDPIYEAINVHKSARATYIQAIQLHSALDRELPMEKCRSSISAWEEKIVETDDPRWIEAEREPMRTSNAETDAALLLIAEPPATVRGAVALLQYVAEVEVDGCSLSWPDSLEDDDGPKIGRDWAYYLHKNLAAAFSDRVIVA